MTEKPLYLIASAIFFFGAIYILVNGINHSEIVSAIWGFLISVMGWIAFWRGF